MVEALPPLSLYIHFPWCVKKCPYCDFNSHSVGRGDIPEADYVQALKNDLDRELVFVQGRPLNSIFFGGGTPSLMSAAAVEAVLDHARRQIGFVENMEITLEANPGTAERERFRDYRSVGVNRISLGVQSFDEQQLQRLGRIHGVDDVWRAVDMLQAAAFDNYNLDLMFALPGQTVAEALADLQRAIDCGPSHLSWYQLTLEPNTVFYREKPALPDDDLQYEIWQAGRETLQGQGYSQYETSAYSRPGRECVHNRHYWEFGDYLGIGAGAHGKVSALSGQGWSVHRRQKTRLPEHYLRRVDPCSAMGELSEAELLCEFAMNGLRLREGVPVSLFQQRTGLPAHCLEGVAGSLRKQGLLVEDPGRFATTERGALFLNKVLEAFLP